MVEDVYSRRVTLLGNKSSVASDHNWLSRRDVRFGQYFDWAGELKNAVVF